MERLLLEFIIRTSLIAGAAGTALWMLRIKTASVRHAAWCGVMLAMLLVPPWLVWGPKASLPMLPPREGFAMTNASLAVAAASPTAAPSRIPPAEPSNWNWSAMLLCVYAVGSGALLSRLALGTILSNRLTSASCIAPVAVGILRPRIILPECWTEWTAAQREAVLAHEREHVRRNDPLVRWLALFNRAVFWFHPLAWWLERKLSVLAEEACDAAVLAQGFNAAEYSGYLLELARSVGRAGKRVNVVAMAMPGSGLPRRIRSLAEGIRPPEISRVRLAAATLACVIPAGMFAAGTLDRMPQILPLQPLPERPLPQPPALIAQTRTQPAAAASQGSPPKLSFEVATIKPAAPPGALAAMLYQVRGGPGSDDPERVTYTNISMHDLLRIAFGLTFEPNLLLGLSTAQENSKYDVAAKIPPRATRNEFNGMLQTLLIERFNLRAHREIRVRPGYELVVAKSGVKLKETAEGAGSEVPVDGRWQGGNPTSKDKDGLPQVTPGRTTMMSLGLPNKLTRLSARNQPIAAFAVFAQSLVHRPIQDKTGLSGKYDFNLDFSPELMAEPPAEIAGPSDPAPDFFSAVQRQLGLRLEPVETTVDVVIVDHMDKLPAEN